jgi:hypothetical protein
MTTDKIPNGLWKVYVDTIPKQTKKVVEVGVADGESLLLMRELLPDATIVGIDILSKPGRLNDSFEHYQLSQDDPKIVPVSINADVIIDDASHKPELTRKTFDLLWPVLNKGGIYYLEDWHPEYLPDMAAVVDSIEATGVKTKRFVFNAPPAAIALFYK